MKKSVLVLVAAISIVSIVIVAFMGATYTIVDNQTIYVQKIYLDVQTLMNPVDASKTIYEVLERKAYLAEHPDKESMFVLDAENDVYCDYVIRIQDYNYLYDHLGNALNLQARAWPDNATNRALRYRLREKDEVYATASVDGEIKYNVQMSETADLIVTITAQDGSGSKTYVKIRNRKYIA